MPAQWLNYPTKGVPRKADGSPNLEAPAPRMADGKPDFSGVWLLERNRPCPADGCTDMEVSQEFMNFGYGQKGGLPLQPWAAELLKSRIEQNGKDDPASNCLPAGVVKLTINPFYRKIVQVPGLVLYLSERDASYRQIFTDGRPLPEDPSPTPNGYSVGRWEGDTLVVETVGITDGQWLDRSGSPLTDMAKITQRFRRVNYGRMEMEITVNDPKAYTKPFTTKVNQLIALDTELLDYFCRENEKDAPHLVGK